MLKKWGLWLTIIVNVLGGLSAAPGVGAAPNAALGAAAIAGVLISVLITVLVVLPSSRRALAVAEQSSRKVSRVSGNWVYRKPTFREVPF
jgi:hypothetical protein